ncbi:MAG: hypothetical protein H6725_04020 [Sandaracinaceae bacterium]|nr:hypothetical protein [Sandaracinaceae bacterium]
MSPQRRARLRRTALVAAVSPFALWLGLTLVLQTGWGRARAGELIVDAVSDAIAGRMRIDEVLSIGLTTAHVRGLAFEDPRGRDVVHIDEAEVHLVLSALLSKTVRFDRARARGAEVRIFTGELNSTSIEDAFGAPDPSEHSDGAGVRVMLDHVVVEDTTVRVLTGASIAIHVSQAGLRLDHDSSRQGADERPTDVVVSGVYGNFFMDGREAISGTDIRATGSIFDLHARVCHPRGLIAMRLLIGGARPRMIYSTDRPLLNIALRMVDRFSDLQMESGAVDLAGVPRCGPAPLR